MILNRRSDLHNRNQRSLYPREQIFGFESIMVDVWRVVMFIMILDVIFLRLFTKKSWTLKKVDISVVVHRKIDFLAIL